MIPVRQYIPTGFDQGIPSDTGACFHHVKSIMTKAKPCLNPSPRKWVLWVIAIHPAKFQSDRDSKQGIVFD